MDPEYAVQAKPTQWLVDWVESVGKTGTRQRSRSCHSLLTRDDRRRRFGGESGVRFRTLYSVSEAAVTEPPAGGLEEQKCIVSQSGG